MKHFGTKILKFIFFGIPIAAIFLSPCIFVIPYQTGDLGRLGGIPFGPYDTIFKTPTFLYTKDIVSFDSLKNIEILTIGDSFSQFQTFGYQNYLGKYINKNIYNIVIRDLTSINTASTLLEKQLMPKCKVIIIESVERKLINNLNCIISIDNIISQRTIVTDKMLLLNPQDTIIRHNEFDFQKLTSFIKNKIDLFDKYKVFTLNTPMFTAANYSDRLYIYKNRLDCDDDLTYSNITQQQIQKAKETLALLKQLGEKHNVQIIFLVAADKYDMYYDYIKDNSYPANPTLDYFSDIDTTFFINTKTLLLPYLRNGEKDIYRVNDTHWSPKAAKIVGEHLGKIITDKHTL